MGMNLERFTTKAQQALEAAQRLAHGYSHQELDGEHLLLALIDQPESLVPLVLQKLGIALPVLKVDLDKELARRHKVQGTSSSDVYLGQNLKKSFDAAEAEAGKLKDEFFSTEHLLLGLLAEGVLKLKAHKLTRDAVPKALVDLRGNQRDRRWAYNRAAPGTRSCCSAAWQSRATRAIRQPPSSRASPSAS
jgi:ATP-dependent Clp protease ATP-binding subunit ClpB